ncbi:hypothetical protein DKX38_001721 [Salix brachista]|uniref:Protein kinase domain-containing protein n=2 Tax=Salix TaxID=40685 RepID=A0A5N5P5K3_9ROSI|nr:hypothetical protein DKX38_001721 [Salix brachista]
MCPKVLTFLLVASIQIYTETYGDDSTVMSNLKDEWGNTPGTWEGADPCGGNWEGITCDNSRVISMTLAGVGLIGQLSGDIPSLSELEVLDLSYNTGLEGSLPPSIVNLKNLRRLKLVGCGFTGPIPESIGSLELLESLELGSNGFTGTIPPSIGNLSKLLVLDLFNNLLEGSIPVSSGTTSGLDMLVKAQHFHLGRNRFSGTIPAELFSSDMTPIHVLLHDNHLTGSIPSTLGLVQSLEAVRFEGNSLTGPVPSNLNNLTSVRTLILSNNKLTGPVPNLTGMAYLNYLDLSNNSFDASEFPSSFSNLQALTTLVMENTGLEGLIPPALFDISSLQTLILRNNKLSGTLDIASSSELKVIDMQNNNISFYPETPERRNKGIVILVGNPVCEHAEATANYCTVPQANSSDTGPPEKCVPLHCISDQILSPNCKCSYPFRGVLVFKPPFLESRNSKKSLMRLEEESLMRSFKLHELPVDSVVVSFPKEGLLGYLESNLSVFPSDRNHFNTTTISDIGFVLTLQTIEDPDIFGPSYFKGAPYPYSPGEPTVPNKLSSPGSVIGAVAGVASFLLLLLLLLLAGVYAYRQKKRERPSEQENHFAYLDLKSSDSVPRLKGARCFSFDEIAKCTNNFSEANHIGTGGYGMASLSLFSCPALVVYRGMLPTGQLIAIKRCRQGSVQGGPEFNAEIEVLSRVHHKNVVNLVGFCFERGEQILIYEFARNGSLRDSLSGLSGVWLDWMRRLKVALGAARGLAYLHELVNPRIIHRDVKSANILLDECLNAKVADFGLSRPMDNSDLILSTTQVKGTVGYIDPEYQKSLLLTEKSDVYGFGVVLLELVTGRKPFERGRFLAAEVSSSMDREKDVYNHHELLDPNIGLDTKPKGLDKIVDLAMKCVQEKGSDRPTMGGVVKEIENILHLAGLNPDAESESTSACFEEASQDEIPPSLREEEVSLS